MRQDLILEEMFSSSPDLAGARAHSRRSTGCPSVARLARGAWTPVERLHLKECSHCRNVVRRSRRVGVPAPAFAVAGVAAMALLLWTGWRAAPVAPAPPQQFNWSAIQSLAGARPQAAPLSSIGAPAPPKLRVALEQGDQAWRYTPFELDRPVAKPLERYTPRRRDGVVDFRTALDAPEPPAIRWAPQGSAGSINQFFESSAPLLKSL